MKRSECNDTPYVPSVEEIKGMTPRLNNWVSLAAWTFGTYRGINEAIKCAKVKDSPNAMHADVIRQQMALLSVIRTFAALDRGSQVSIQSVHRYLCASEGIEELNALASSNNAPEAPALFLAAYKNIDFAALSKLQGFRNTLAHATWKDVKKFVTYGELEVMVRTSCALCHQLNLITCGLNDDPSDHIEDGEGDAFEFWEAVLHSGLDGA